MRTTYWTIIGFATMGLVGGCAMHHESKRDLLTQANVSLIEAVRTAEANVINAKTVEAELEREDGRTVYEVEMIDSTQKKRTVYIDAATGKIMKID